MCGIAGFFGEHPFIADAYNQLKLMISQLRHRGPDGFGLYQSAGTGLAHARLSIIDLEGGAQPIHNEDQTIWTVFNGEIFNYIELRAYLESAGHKFYTNTDTEVIVHLYEEHGIDFVNLLNGQFAIALWDDRRKEGFLIRDRVGIQPLFWASRDGVGNTIYFGSEIKALLAVPHLRRGISQERLAEVFTYWTTLPGYTVFEGIFEVPQGHYLRFDRFGAHAIKQYWDHSYDPSESNGEDVEALRIQELLEKSVRLRLRSDVPVGAYLSGGLDSTIIASLVNQITDNELHTFSIEFDDKQFNEANYQQRVSDYLGDQIKHTSYQCSRDMIAHTLPQVIYHTEKPILRTAPVPMFLLSKMVKDNGYKVVLTGEGADEVFGGYDLFRENYARRLYAENPVRWNPEELFSQLYPWMQGRMTTSPAYLKAFFNADVDRHAPWFSHVPRWNTTMKTHNFFSEEMKANLNIDFRNAPTKTNVGWLQQAQYLEFHTLFAGYLISSQGDRMLMANGVEGRFPFLDPQVVNYANHMSPYYKLNGMNEKFILKHAFRGRIPEEIRWRSKQPYMAPDGSSFFKDGGCLDIINDVISPFVLNRVGYFDHKKVSILRKKFEKGIAKGFPENMAMVGIVSTMFLHDLFIERPNIVDAADDDEFLVNHRG